MTKPELQTKIRILGKLHIHYCKHDSFPIVTDLSGEISDVINECEFSLLYNKICYRLEHLHYSYLPNNQFMM